MNDFDRLHDQWKLDNNEVDEVLLNGTLEEYELEAEYEDKLMSATFDIEIVDSRVVNMATTFIGAVDENGISIGIKKEDYNRHKFLFDNTKTHNKILEDNQDNNNLY